MHFNLLKWQENVLNDKTRFKIINAGRRCGKTRYAAITLLINGLTAPNGADVMYIAPTQGQARKLIWKLLHQIGSEVIKSSHINNMEITLINGVTIYVCGADNPDTLRGPAIWYAVLDEYAFMKKDIWEEIIRPTLADHKGSALFISSPDFDNHFKEVYDMGMSGDKEYKSWHLTTYDNETIDRAEIEAAKRTLSTFAFKKEFLASFDTAGPNIFKEEWLKYGVEPVESSCYIAIDLAGFEAVSAGNKKTKLDQCAISVVKLQDNGKWFVQKIEYGRWDIRETAVRILKNIREYRPLACGIERGALFNAVMPYLTDLMRKNNIYAHVSPLTHGNQAKNDRVIWALQGMFEHGRIILNSDEDWSEFKNEYMMFPSKGVHDDCFPATAPIITLDGVKEISTITTDDYVLTRNGFRRVLKAWCKGYKHVITRYGITATPDHRIWTDNRGWVSIDSLCDDDTLIHSQPVKETSCANQLNSTVEPIIVKLIDKVCATQSVNDSGLMNNNEINIPVYDLMVEYDHEFFAYGVLVHNCIDSLSMIGQMAITSYATDDNLEEYEALDIISGI